MREVYKFWILAFLLIAVSPVHGQFLKNLKKKVERRVEQTVTDKIANKAAQEAGKKLDNLMEGKIGGGSPLPIGTEQGDIGDVPESYDFEWAYGLRIESAKSKEGMDIVYYLKEDAPYWGARIQQGMSLFMVYDLGNKLTVIFMENEGNNFISVTKVPENAMMEAEDMMDENEVSLEDYTFREIQGKEILGYSCKGYEMENDEFKYTFFNTFETEVSFSDIYGKSEQIPKGFNIDWFKEGDKEGLIMEMIMEDKSGKNDTYRMRCTKLEKEPLSLRKSDYSSFGEK